MKTNSVDNDDLSKVLAILSANRVPCGISSTKKYVIVSTRYARLKFFKEDRKIVEDILKLLTKDEK